MKFDIHVHPMLEMGKSEDFGRVTERLLDCMERAGIDRANIMPFMYAPPLDEDVIEFCASYMTEVLLKYPEKFYGMLWINPLLPIDYLRGVVEKFIINGPTHGVKLLTELNAGDGRMEPLAAFLEKNDVPVLIHSWYNNLSTNINESRPRDIALLAEKFPSLRIVMAHLRGAGYRGVQDIKKHINVGIDTSGSESEDMYLSYALKELGPDRVYFGTDYPGRDFAVAAGRIESVEMPRDVRAKVFGLNAENFLSKRGK